MFKYLKCKFWVIWSPERKEAPALSLWCRIIVHLNPQSFPLCNKSQHLLVNESPSLNKIFLPNCWWSLLNFKIFLKFIFAAECTISFSCKNKNVAVLNLLYERIYLNAWPIEHQTHQTHLTLLTQKSPN